MLKMSDCDTEVEQKNSAEEFLEAEKVVEPQVSDDEDDCEGYFLEPVGGNLNIAEKIAEANKKLFEEEEDDEGRPRKVQFSDKIINFEPIDYSDEDITESARNSIISEEDLELKLNEEEEDEVEKETSKKTESTPEKQQTDAEILENLVVSELTDNENFKCESDEIIEVDEIVEELETNEIRNEEEPSNNNQSPRSKKLLFVLLPKDQNSSCESIIGEEIIIETNYKEEKNLISDTEKVPKTKIARPKSAYNSKLKKSCEMSKISPNLNYSSNLERTSWQGSRNISTKPKTNTERKEKKSSDEIKVKITGRFLKKINIDDLNLENIRNVGDFNLKRCAENRPKSSHNDKREIASGGMRPKTAPLRRTCCVIKTELPSYNGFRSEYGLSAEQLEERKQRTLEIKHQRKQIRLKERQEEMRKRNENEKAFQKWLYNKKKNSLNKKPIKIIDMLARSDMYIQTHASYATNRNVPYSVDYTLNKKFNNKKTEVIVKKTNKTINVAKYLDKVSPHFKRSFNIYLGLTPA